MTGGADLEIRSALQGSAFAVALGAWNLHVADMRCVLEVAEIGVESLLQDRVVAIQARAIGLAVVAALARAFRDLDRVHALFRPLLVSRMAILAFEAGRYDVSLMREAAAEDPNGPCSHARMTIQTR